MLADFFTKPLQGYLFHRFKAVVLGHAHVDSLHDLITHSLEERVEENDRSNSRNSLYSEELDVGVKRVDFALAEIGTCSTKPTYKPTYAEIAKGTYSAVKKSTSSVLRESHSLKRIQ
jgi:hypothetical protein